MKTTIITYEIKSSHIIQKISYLIKAKSAKVEKNLLPKYLKIELFIFFAKFITKKMSQLDDLGLLEQLNEDSFLDL